MSKKSLLAIHSWVGLKLSLLMFIICLTGTLAVISHELDWLLNSDRRVTVSNDIDDNHQINWDLIIDKVSEAYPQANVLDVGYPLYPNFAVTVRLIDPELGIWHVFVDPYTNQIQGDASHFASAQRILRDLHRYLLYPSGGIYIVGPLGIIVLMSTITALLFYRKWWRGFFKLKLNDGPRAFWGSLHKVVGLWSIWFLLLIGITGTWYLAEALIRNAGVKIQYAPVKIQQNKLIERRFFEQHIDVSDAIVIAKQQINGFKPTGVLLPFDQSSPIAVSGYTNAILTRARANAVFIDGITGEVVKVRESKRASAMTKWVDMADPLHFGNFAGLPVKLIWFLFGALMTLMSASGVVIFVKRVAHKKQGSSFHAVLGRAKYLSLLVLVVPVVMGVLLTLYSTNQFAYIEHDKVHSLSTEPSINNAKFILYSARQEHKLKLRIGFDCYRCIPKKYELFLVLNNGDRIPFKTGFSGYRLTPTATIDIKRFSDIAYIELIESEQNKLKLFID